ncbi:MAG TPA: FG-GAP-like repeat-containing protein [Anaeromyxobacteraceae bacterium]|nr:FG-GAP-like repeat-containing protein [Anaeromyxobacteraceae bacterium]
MRWIWVGVFLAGGLAGCKGGGAVTQDSGCPAGQVRDASGACLASCGAAQPCGGVCCPAGQTCQAGNVCGATPPAAGCGTGPACSPETFCLGGSCVSADPSCSYKPPPGPFTPRVAWQWTGSTDQPAYAQVLMTPVVIPLRRSGGDAFTPPAVVFNAILDGLGAGDAVPGRMRAVSGRDGTDLWSSDPNHPVNGMAAIAAGDLLGDGNTEFVTARMPAQIPGTPSYDHATEGLIAFDNTGKFLWEVPGIPVEWGAPAVANFGGAEARVVMGASVVDAHGKLLCTGQYGTGNNLSYGPLSVVADIDGDGVPDIVTGNAVYDANCQPKPGWPNGQLDGAVAVADFIGDAHPQIVVVSGMPNPAPNPPTLSIRLQDWQGKVIWGPVTVVNGGAGGAPTVADFDGDGKLEIGVAARAAYRVFKPFAANPILWEKPTQDMSDVTGSSVFDFTHDGKAEVVYGDECYTRVYDGTTGATEFESPNPSCTVYENPVIADVDKDGRAEIVVATNSVCNISCPWGNHVGSGRHGVTVFKDLRDHWVSTRAVWNQHSYHVTNVNEDGSLPAPEQNNWTVPGLNNYRMNVIGNPDYSAPDLEAVAANDVTLDRSGCPATLKFTVRVWNRGAVLVTAGVPIAVYQGAAGGPLLATAKTAGAITPGNFESVVIPLPSPPSAPTTVVVVLNDDGTGQGVVGECRRDNNVLSLPGAYCPVGAK